jgi:hypothetical protein
MVKVTTQADQVLKCNSELKAQLSDLEGHRENPRLIALIKSLVKLTGTPEDVAAIEEAEGPSEAELKQEAIKKQIAELQKQLD